MSRAERILLSVAYAVILLMWLPGCASQDRIRKDYDHPFRVKGKTLYPIEVIPGVKVPPKRPENPVIMSDSQLARAGKKRK